MQKFILSCCSTADLTKEHFEARDIKYLCYQFTLNNVTYKDNLGKSMSFENFYKALASGADAKTSLVNADEFIDYFSPFLQAGQDVLHICFSSGLSGSCNSAVLASDELAKKYPDRKLRIVDSLCASSGYGLFMDKLADLRDEGMGIDELAAWANANKLSVNHLFFSTTLSFYVKGGRISKTAGAVGTLLNICPLMNMDSNGKLTIKSKVIGKKKAMRKTVDKMEELSNGGLDYAEKCYISNSACIDDAKALAALIESRFLKLKGKIVINSIGTVIGSHTGPGTIALFFWGKPRNQLT